MPHFQGNYGILGQVLVFPRYAHSLPRLMNLFTIRLRAMHSINDEQLDGLMTEMQYLHSRDDLRQILTDGHASNAAEHIKEENVTEITDFLASIGLEYELIAE